MRRILTKTVSIFLTICLVAELCPATVHFSHSQTCLAPMGLISSDAIPALARHFPGNIFTAYGTAKTYRMEAAGKHTPTGGAVNFSSTYSVGRTIFRFLERIHVKSKWAGPLNPSTHLTAREEAIVELTISPLWEWFLNPIKFWRKHDNDGLSGLWRGIWLGGMAISMSGVAIISYGLFGLSETLIFVALTKVVVHLNANLLNRSLGFGAPLTLNNDLEALISQLKSPTSSVVTQAIRALANKRGEARPAIFALITAAGSPDFEISYAAQDALRVIGPPNADQLNDLVKLLDSRSLKIVKAVVSVLGTMRTGARPAIPALTVAAGSSDIEVRVAAQDALRAIGPGTADQLEETMKLLNSTVPRVVEAAAFALGAMRGVARPAIPALIGTAGSSDMNVRVTVQNALRVIGPATADQVNDIVKLLNSTVPRVVEAAASALGAMRGTARPAIPALAVAAGSSDVRIRIAAQDALNVIGPAGPELLDAIIELLKSPSDQSAERAAITIGAMKKEAKKAIPYLINMAGHGNPSVRMAVTNALSSIGPAPAVLLHPIMDLLDSPSNSVVQKAAESLGAMGADAEPAISILKKLTEHSDAWIRTAARYAVSKIESSLRATGHSRGHSDRNRASQETEPRATNWSSRDDHAFKKSQMDAIYNSAMEQLLPISERAVAFGLEEVALAAFEDIAQLKSRHAYGETHPDDTAYVWKFRSYVYSRMNDWARWDYRLDELSDRKKREEADKRRQRESRERQQEDGRRRQDESRDRRRESSGTPPRSQTPSPYAVLGVSPDAAFSDIQKEYRRLRYLWHPDRYTDAQVKTEAEARAKEINAAFDKIKKERGVNGNGHATANELGVFISVAAYLAGINPWLGLSLTMVGIVLLYVVFFSPTWAIVSSEVVVSVFRRSHRSVPSTNKSVLEAA